MHRQSGRSNCSAGGDLVRKSNCCTHRVQSVVTAAKPEQPKRLNANSLDIFVTGQRVHSRGEYSTCHWIYESLAIRCGSEWYLQSIRAASVLRKHAPILITYSSVTIDELLFSNLSSNGPVYSLHTHAANQSQAHRNINLDSNTHEHKAIICSGVRALWSSVWLSEDLWLRGVCE